MDFSDLQLQSSLLSFSQFNLVCEQQGVVAASQSAYMAGHLISALTVGAISDRHVRSIQIISSHVQFVFTATSLSNGHVLKILLPEQNSLPGSTAGTV